MVLGNDLTCQGPGMADIGFFWLGLVGGSFVWWCRSHEFRNLCYGVLLVAGVGVKRVSYHVRCYVCEEAQGNRWAIEDLLQTLSPKEGWLAGGRAAPSGRCFSRDRFLRGALSMVSRSAPIYG